LDYYKIGTAREQGMKRILLFSYLLLLLLISGAPSSSWAQSSSTTGSIIGTVKDPQGSSLVGAAITARQIKTNLERTAQVGDDGIYQFVQLTPGNYEVKVHVEGFVPQTEAATVNIGTTVLVEFVLSVNGSNEIIEVSSNSLLNEGKTENSTVIDNKRIENLPINQRDFLGFSLTTARAVKDRLPAQGAIATSKISFNGQTARSNNITIDGLDNNDLSAGSVRSTFSQEAVQEFQVVADNYNAEFGRALGGVINIVTKGGTNEFHGNTFFFIRNDSISARDSFSAIEPPFDRYQFGATLGGPVKRDKLFFFTSFERLTLKQNNIVTIRDATVTAAARQGFVLKNGPVPFSKGTSSFLGRLDAQFNANDRLTVRYNGSFNYDGAFEPFGELLAESTGGIQRLDDNSIAANNTYISNKFNLVNETRFLFSRLDQNVTTPDPGPLVNLFAPEGQVIFGRSTILPQPRQLRVYQFVDNVSLTRGRHQIKFGVDFNLVKTPLNRTPIFAGGFFVFTQLDFSTLSGIPGLPSFTGLQTFDPTQRTPEQRAFLTLLSGALPIQFPGFPRGLPLADLGLPAAYIQSFGNPRLENTTKLLSIYFQDDIRLRPNLLVKLGTRYDLNRVGFLPKNSGNVSPRIALSYRPAKFEKLHLRAAYGLFFTPPSFGIALFSQLNSSGKIQVISNPFPFSILPFMRPGHSFPESEQAPDNITSFPQFFQSVEISKDLRSSYTQQTTAGFDYYLDKNTAISITYDFVRGIKLLSDRNINPIVRPVPGDILLSTTTGRIDPSRGDIREFESAHDSYYHAVTFAIERRFTNRFGFLAHYTYSKNIDNALDSVAAQLDEIQDPLHIGNERGLSIQDLRHRCVVSGVWELSYSKNPLLRDYQLSAILNLESGRPYNLIAGVDLNMNGDNPPGDRPAGLGRNVGILPGFAGFDLRLTRSISISDRFKLHAIAEVFNLFNRVNISQIDRVYPPDAQGNFNLPPQQDGRFIATPDRFRGAFEPRQVQFGVKLAF
jgi:hypothetical protein